MSAIPKNPNKMLVEAIQWIEDFRAYAEINNHKEFALQMEATKEAFKLAKCPSSLKKISTFHKLKTKIKKHHQDKNDFDLRYMKLTKKVTKLLDNMSSDLLVITIEENTKINIFEDDYKLFLIENDLRNLS